MFQKKHSVSDIISLIKENLESSYSNIFISGEISNLTRSHTGHWYFSLKDEKSLINGALFKMDAMRNPLIQQLKDGQKISVQGSISVYAPRGSFQVIAKRIYLEGEGLLQAQYEKLKKKLREEGLFDLEKKKQIPRFPKKVAIITSLRAAALQDFLKIIKRRMFWGEFVVIDSLVQGKQAPRSLLHSLGKAERKGDFDLIVLTRGGGSLEDLWAFNDEELVRRVAQSSTPIISAIGHEVDYTLCDFVSDLRCETPSAAAEVISQSQTQLKNRMNHLKNNLQGSLRNRSHQVSLIKQKSNPQFLIAKLQNKLQIKNDEVERLSPLRVEKSLKYEDHLFRIDELFSLGHKILQQKHDRLTQKVIGYEGFLKGVNPNLVLERGYAYLKAEGVLSSAKKFDKTKEDRIEVIFKDGKRYVQKA